MQNKKTYIIELIAKNTTNYDEGQIIDTIQITTKPKHLYSKLKPILKQNQNNNNLLSIAINQSQQLYLQNNTYTNDIITKYNLTLKQYLNDL